MKERILFHDFIKSLSAGQKLTLAKKIKCEVCYLYHYSNERRYPHEHRLRQIKLFANELSFNIVKDISQ